MKKLLIIIFIFLIAILLSIFIFKSIKNKPKSISNSLEFSKISTNVALNNTNENITFQNFIQENNIINKNNTDNAKTEEEISSFSTKIYTKTSERQNNVKLACSELNETIVKARRNIFFYKYSR